MWIFWDIFSTPNNMNSKRWMIKRCTGIRKHMKGRKGIWSTPKAWFLDHRRRKRMKNDELETIEHLHGKSPDKNFERKEWRDFPLIKGYMIKKPESLKKKGGRVGKQRQLGSDETNTVEKKLRTDLVNVGMTGCTWRETRRLERIGMTISIIKKDYHPHRNMRTPFRNGMESTVVIEATRIPQIKQNKGFGLQNKQEQTYDRDFVRSFHGGAHTG